MITYSNIKRHDRLPFEDYLCLPGYSHSFLKQEQGGVIGYLKPTQKMLLGSMVDAMLTDGDVDMMSPIYRMARKIALQIQSQYGTLIKQFQSQVSFTGTVSFAGLNMPTCGRLDWLLPGHADIDLKVTGAASDAEFRSLVTYMGYDNQQWNYAKLAQVPAIYILPYSIKLKRCLSLVSIPVTESNPFWEKAILKYGRAVE